mgnify:CR=1 FL=1
MKYHVFPMVGYGTEHARIAAMGRVDHFCVFRTEGREMQPVKVFFSRDSAYEFCALMNRLHGAAA